MADTRYAAKSGFYDSQNRDRLYSADDMNEPYKAILTEGIVEDTTGFQVTNPSGTTLKVAAGKAILGGKWVDAEDTNITVPSNTALYGRIDAVVLQVDTRTETRAAAIVYRTGTPAETPEAPALLTTTDITEVRLANVAVSTSDAITITDTRGGSDCPYITIQVGDSQIQAAVEDVLEAHPEWTTTVEDGSITLQKLASGVIDNTLTQAGAAADAKATGDALTALNNDFENLSDYVHPYRVFTNSILASDGGVNPYPGTTVGCYKLDKNKLYRFVRSNDSNVSIGLSDLLYNGENALLTKRLVSDSNVYDYFPSRYTYVYTNIQSSAYKCTCYEKLSEEISEASQKIYDGFSALIGGGAVELKTIPDINSFVYGKALNSSGSAISDAKSYAITDFVPINGNMSITIDITLANVPSQNAYLYACFYSDSAEASYISRVGGQITSPYTKHLTGQAPANAKYLRVSLTYVGESNVSSVSVNMGCEFEPFNPIYPYLHNKSGIILGDSISYGLYSYWDGSDRKNSDGLSPDYAQTRISDYFAGLAGMSMTNIAKRGTGYVADSRNLGNALAKANATDFSDYDFVGLCFGINDYIQGITLGTMEADLEGTVVGNLMRVLKKIYSDNPLAKVVIFSPYNAWGQVAVNQGSNSLYGDESTNYALGYANAAGYTLQDLVDALDEVAQYYGVTHEKLNKSNIINRINIKDILIDGLHPSLDSLPMLAAEMFAQKDFG